MANIETYYLVDFENVNEKGLESSDELGEHDHIYIFILKIPLKSVWKYFLKLIRQSYIFVIFP